MQLIGLFRVPAYLQLAPLPEEPCGSGNATDYQRLIGIMGLSPLRGTLRAAPGNPGTEVSLYPTSPSWRTPIAGTSPQKCYTGRVRVVFSDVFRPVYARGLAGRQGIRYQPHYATRALCG